MPRANPRLPPYLVLLRVGFALPAALLRRRCALTAPFHPYPAVVVSPWHGRQRTHNDGEAVCFLWHFPSSGLESALPDVIRHTALRSSDFPLPFGSDRPVRLPTSSLYSMPVSAVRRRPPRTLDPSLALAIVAIRVRRVESDAHACCPSGCRRLRSVRLKLASSQAETECQQA